MTDIPQTTTHNPRAFWLALALNFVWINVSEVWRYFAIVKPKLLETFPDVAGIAPTSPGIIASWMLWDTVLILAATGTYWLFLKDDALSLSRAYFVATCFTITVFGLIWLGIANMGLAPISFLWAALPLAWAEQAIAALIVLWAMRRG